MKHQLILIDRVEKLILLLRGEKVLLSRQLAGLYGVPVKVLIQAVKRNRSRFPEDFIFQLSRAEFDNLKSQMVTSSWGGRRRAVPYAFTEQGVAVLWRKESDHAQPIPVRRPRPRSKGQDAGAAAGGTAAGGRAAGLVR